MDPSPAHSLQGHNKHHPITEPEMAAMDVDVVGEALQSQFQTLYCNNLNEKIHLEDLRRGLYSMFSMFGPVLDIVAGKSLKKRGQAFVRVSTPCRCAVADPLPRLMAVFATFPFSYPGCVEAARWLPEPN